MINNYFSGKFDYFNMIYKRFVRLTPVIAFILIFTNDLRLSMENSLDYEKAEVILKPCQEYWWSTLLHVQGYTNPSEMVRFSPSRVQGVLWNLYESFLNHRGSPLLRFQIRRFFCKVSEKKF